MPPSPAPSAPRHPENISQNPRRRISYLLALGLVVACGNRDELAPDVLPFGTPHEEESTGSGTTEAEVTGTTDDGTSTIDESTTSTTAEPEPECEPDYCAALNTLDCIVEEGVMQCLCKEGVDSSQGSQCEFCLPGYENEGTEKDPNCMLDETAPEPIIYNGDGETYTILTNSFFFYGSCVDGCEATEANEAIVKVNDGPEEILPNFTYGDEQWDQVITDIQLGETAEVCVSLVDLNGNQSPYECLSVAHQ